MTPSQPNRLCTIEAKRLPLALASHMYFEIFDEQGQRIAQVHGLAVGRLSGQPKSIGIPGDGLRAFVGTGFVLRATQRSTRDHHPHKGGVVFSGSRADIDRVLVALQARADILNAYALPYLLTSLNSNTIFAQMVAAMEEVVPLERSGLSAATGLWLAPGLKCDFAEAVKKYVQPSAQPQDIHRQDGATPVPPFSVPPFSVPLPPTEIKKTEPKKNPPAGDTPHS